MFESIELYQQLLTYFFLTKNLICETEVVMLTLIVINFFPWLDTPIQKVRQPEGLPHSILQGMEDYWIITL